MALSSVVGLDDEDGVKDTHAAPIGPASPSFCLPLPLDLLGDMPRLLERRRTRSSAATLFFPMVIAMIPIVRPLLFRLPRHGHLLLVCYFKACLLVTVHRMVRRVKDVLGQVVSRKRFRNNRRATIVLLLEGSAHVHASNQRHWANVAPSIDETILSSVIFLIYVGELIFFLLYEMLTFMFQIQMG